MADLAQTKDGNANTAYEHGDWSIGAVALIYLAIFVLLVISPFVMLWTYSSADASRKLLARPPAPELQVDPGQDLARFRAHEKKLLHTYYWVDKEKGIVHIPIEEAMKKLAQTGIDGFPKSKP